MDDAAFLPLADHAENLPDYLPGRVIGIHRQIRCPVSGDDFDQVFRRIGDWMNGLGWESAKKVHELRAWTGSKIAEQHGLEQASRFLRHKDLRTTQKFYARYLRLKGVDLVLPGLKAD